jgi:hypothetical protein
MTSRRILTCDFTLETLPNQLARDDCPPGVVLEPDLSLITDRKSRILISGENVHITSGLTWIKTSKQLSFDPHFPVPIKQSHEFSPSTGAM